MIKKLFLLLFAMLLTMQVSAQSGGNDPVSLEEFFTVNGEEGTIRFKATIEEGYHLYSTDIPKGGPTPVSIKFHVMEGAEVVGPLVAGEGAKQEYDDLFGMNVSYFENEAELIQQVKLLGGAYRIKGTVSYQSCGNGNCYMGRHDFELTGTADVQAKAVQPKAVKRTKPAIKKFKMKDVIRR